MTVEASDVHQVLEFRAATAIVRLLPVGLGLCFLGLLAFALFDNHPPGEVVLAASMLLAAGPAIVGLALWTRSNPGKPQFVLSPAGVHYRIPWVKMIFVPWHEVHGIESIDITTSNWSIRNPGTFTFSDVTAILVSKQFYDKHIHIDSLFLRGPAWGNIFIPKGSFVQFALHHELVSTESRMLREAVEARWRAFRQQAAPPVPATPKGASVPAMAAGWRRAARRGNAAPPQGIAMGDKPGSMSIWDKLVISASLIGIAIVAANLLGLRATEGQTQGRAHRANWANEERRMQEERREIQKGLNETDRRIKEILGRF